MKAAVVATGPADLRDQAWLDERVSAIENGIDAVLDIAVNWFDGRRLARLHPGVSPAEYVKSKVGSLRLGKADVTVLLAETNWSNRQIAAVAGVSRNDVNELALSVPVERPVSTLGGDGKLRPSVPFRPRLDPMPYSQPGPRPGGAVIEDRPTPFRLVAQTFERDARRLLDAYRLHLNDERFNARFGAVLAAIESALQEEK